MENKLTYSEFIQAVVKELKGKLNGTAEIEIKEVLKNNDVDKRAILIRKMESSVCPTIYMEGYYQDYLRGKSVAQITENVLDVFHNSKMEPAAKDYEMTLNNMQDKIVFRLLNFNSNQRFLSGKPYIRCVDDLVMTFHCIVRQDEGGVASICITDECMEKLGLTLEELKDLAMVNTRKMFPEQIGSMGEILTELMGDDAEQCKSEIDNNCGMYVISNQSKVYGAGCILYPEVLHQFSDKIQSNLLILPSSVHETIVLPFNKQMNLDDMRLMVKEINRTQVAPEEVLSDNVYLYDYKTDVIRVA